MSTLTLVSLSVFLVILILLSAFFSGSETALMSLNRYKLRHIARQGHKTALRVSRLLERPDRLLGVVLIGNTIANIVAGSIVTTLAHNIGGSVSMVIANTILIFVILIVAEITPKTLATLYAQRIAFIVSYPLVLIMKILYPIVWLANGIVNRFLSMFKIEVDRVYVERLNMEELRTVVLESSGRISPQHQELLLRILEMEEVTVDDVMIPRNEIVGIDLNDDWEKILTQLTSGIHTKIPLYHDDIDNVIGIVHLREALKLLGHNQLNKTTLADIAQEIYFIPEGTPLHMQLLNFRREQRRIGLVVDEYGDIQGLVTLEDILKEIVGEFTAEVPAIAKSIELQSDGSYLIEGNANIRELNRLLNWELPVDGPKTLSGLIIEDLEAIPENDVCILINRYPIEIIHVEGNLIKKLRILPRLPVVQKKKEE